ncbi:MAG: hypothetical protein SFX19_02530 [Alphaproteobacteria bacterium]|nr:hypothetical protein [Alphaproteobacteria bacterium]
MTSIIENIRRFADRALPTKTGSTKHMEADQFEKIAIVDENEAAYAEPSSKQPVLFTRSLIQCMACVIVDPATKRAGIMHINKNGMQVVSDALAAMAEEIRGTNTGNRLELHIIGGLEKNIIAQFAHDVGTLPNADIKTFVVDEDKKDTSFAYDTRTGDMVYGSQLEQDLLKKLIDWQRFPLPEAIDAEGSLTDDKFDEEIKEREAAEIAFYDSCKHAGKIKIVTDGFAPENQAQTRPGMGERGAGGLPGFT